MIDHGLVSCLHLQTQDMNVNYKYTSIWFCNACLNSKGMIAHGLGSSLAFRNTVHGIEQIYIKLVNMIIMLLMNLTTLLRKILFHTNVKFMWNILEESGWWFFFKKAALLEFGSCFEYEAGDSDSESIFG